MHLRTCVLILLSLLLLFPLSGCKGKEEYQDLDAYVAELQRNELKRHSKHVVKIEIPVPETITYQSKNLRAPFQREGATTGAKPLAVDPLQRHPLSVLRFVGTVTKNNVTYAYIMSPDGMLYEVKRGDLIGDRHGKVTSIESKRITITEEVGPGKRAMQTMQLREE